jgi:RND family efflux transporter MFP subunit
MSFRQTISGLLTLAVLAAGTGACKARSGTGPAAAKPAEEATPVAITLKPEAIKTAGIKTAEAAVRPYVRTIKAVGEVAFDPKRTAHIAARTSGRIEKLFAYQGDKVRAGQPLAQFYSKDFLSLQSELLQALERVKREGLEEDERLATRRLLESARNRIRLLDVAEDDLAAIEKGGQAMTLLPIRAPIAGTVLEALSNAGDYMDAGVDIFRLADLTAVWVNLHIFEKDIAAVRPGSEAAVRAAAFPGRTFAGRIFQLGSVLDEKTRTIEARIEMPNLDGDLRPGMYVDADVRAAGESRALFVPAEALQDFQGKKVVFVRTGEGVFSLREVETGPAFEGSVEILQGLKDGETVATAGSFFLKSELLKKTLGEDAP